MLTFTLIIHFLFNSLFAQQPSFKLVNVRLVGVNISPKIDDITRIQRYYESAGMRINIYSQEQLTLDSIKLPRLSSSSVPNHLMTELIKLNQSKHKAPNLNSLTIFCLPRFNIIPTFQSFLSFGYAFYESTNSDDNFILSSVAHSLGVAHYADSSRTISDSASIFKLRLATINYSTDINIFNKIEETGLMAYYIWEENEEGIIDCDPNNPLMSIKRGKKENFGYKYLNPGNWFFKPFTEIMDTKICPAHLTVVIVTIIGLVLFFKLIRNLTRNRNLSLKIGGWMLKIFSVIFSLFTIGFSFYLINLFYINHFVIETKIEEFDNDVKASRILNKIQDNLLFEKDTTLNLGTQIFRKKNDEWYIQRNLPVLIFRMNKKNEFSFKEGSNSLTYRGDTLIHDTQNHYIKIEWVNDSEEVVAERIYDYFGNEVYSTEIFERKKGKRIVLFVNGYRAPFLTQDDFSRTVMLKRILENKTENDKTNNKIYDFDIFEYWNQWRRFDERFISKLQPHEVYYADGHHPIRTSNYNLTKIPLYVSLLNNLGDLSYFYFAASHFPGRCDNLSNHSCNYVNIPNVGVKSTWELLPTAANHSGFNERRISGSIAGKNVLQLLNGDNSNLNPNDTLFIVCHSMGFAYSQGIIEALRGKINFGAYYIFSPENPSSGRVLESEWDQVWQYGANEEIEECLQDGIAPQCAIKGIEKNRVFFPQALYPELGFTGSHFIGNFSWVFDLKNTQPGHIKQH